MSIGQNKIGMKKVMSKKAGNYVLIKRVFDLVVSSLLLIILSPFLLFIGLLIYLDDGTPVIFRQTRVGKNGREFIIWKFRTMPKINERQMNRQRAQKNWSNGVPDDFVFKSAEYEEISKLGRILRKYSIDELPQLVNVIRGDMSLIGPRPEVPEIACYYNKNQQIRLAVKPGMTGYAQVNGRSHLNHGQKINYDRHYVNNYCFRMDLFIIGATVMRVIKADDNY